MVAFKAINVILVLVYSFGSALWVNSGDSWYRNLNQPSWQPPDWVFGIIWPYNFIVIAIIGWRLADHASRLSNIAFSSLLVIAVTTALLWSYSFYSIHNIARATLFLALVVISSALFTVISFINLGAIALILVPYVAWVSTATLLSYSYQKLN